jgi:hypothetical protein
MNHKLAKNMAVSALALTSAFATAQDIQVTVDGTPVTFHYAQPQMVDGRVLVPLRGVFEQIGANVDWDEATQTVMADGHGRHVRLQIGSHDAVVNGRTVSIGVPPQMHQGSTMVPLRFLGEALGAHVDWQSQNNLVALTTRDGYGQPERFDAPRPRPDRPAPTQPYVFSRSTVIPMALDQEISSDGNQPGDRITATVRGDNGRYMDFPQGTILEGVVKSAQRASGSNPGTLDVRFRNIVFPDGSKYRVSGVVTRLDDRNIVREGNRFVARGGPDNVARDAEIGAGAGFLLGSIKGRAIGGAAVGGILGAIVGAVEHNTAHNVRFDSGAQFGLILNRDLTIDRADLR